MAAVLALAGETGRGVEGPSADPATRGPYSVGERSEHFPDAARGRAIETLVFFPSRDGKGPDSAAVPCPLALFSHGFLLRGEAYRSYGERLASHGFVVFLPTYPMTFLDVDHRVLVEDLRFLITSGLALPRDHPLAGAIDPGRVGVAGHSLGGKISLLAASEDPCIRSAALLDPVDGGPPGGGTSDRFPCVTPERMKGVDVPLLLVGSELGGLAVAGLPCAPVPDNYQRFFEAAHAPAIEVTQVGAGHMQYLDDADCGLLCGACAQGTRPSGEVREGATAYLTEFFLWTLGGDPSGLEALRHALTQAEAAGQAVVRWK